MKITFLGTSAGEGYPSPWCNCPNCDYARTHGGKNLRYNSSILIDDDLLIDLTAQSFSSAAQQRLSLDKVQTLLITHAHPDHFTPEILWTRHLSPKHEGLTTQELVNRVGAPRVTAVSLMNIYGNHYVKDAIGAAGQLTAPYEQYALRFNLIAGGAQIVTPTTTITALNSLHVSPDFTLNYIIERDQRTVLYATDTGGYDESTLQQLCSRRYDCVILEGTTGLLPCDDVSHMSLEKSRQFFKMLQQHHAADDNTICCLTHMAPHWTPPHDIFAPMMKKEGLEVAFDGKVIDLQPA